MSEQTDTIEAVALEKLRADLDEATKHHMPAMVVTTDYLRSVLDRIAALRAENFMLAAGACINPGDGGLVGDEHGNSICTVYEDKLKLEAEVTDLMAKLNEAQAQLATARIEGVRAGIEASAGIVERQSDYTTVTPFVQRDRLLAEVRALDPAAIVEGME